MLRLEEVLQLKDGEEIRLVSKKHPVSALPSLSLASLLIILPFFFLFPLFRTGPTGIVLFIFVVLTGLITAWRGFIMWDGDALVVSTVRVLKVSQTGMFARTVHEISIETIREVSWTKKGLLGYFFHYGDVMISGGQLPIMCAQCVPNPQEVHALLNDFIELRDRKVKREENGRRDDRVDRVSKLVEDLKDADLRALESVLKNKEKERAFDAVFSEPVQKERVSEHEEMDSEEILSEEDGEGDEKSIIIKKLFEEGGETKLKSLDDTV